MPLLLILAIIAAVFIGLGFVIKWLFIIAAIVVLVAIISFAMRSMGRGSRV